MLSLVAGPYDIVGHAGEVFLPKARACLWHEPPPAAAAAGVASLGLLMLADGAVSDNPNEAYAVQLDGSALHLGTQRLAGTDRIVGFGWRHDDVAVIARNAGGYCPIHFPSTKPLAAFQTTSSLTEANFALLSDRVLASVAGRIRAGDLNANSDTIECSLEGGASQAGFMLPYDIAGDRSLWWAVVADTGNIYLYDADAQAATFHSTFGSAVTGAAYSRKHDVFIAVRVNTTPTPDVAQLSIYANEPEAASVSEPTFSATPTKGAICTLSAQVLGSANEPCAGRVVQFSVTEGEVDPAAVLTDETGTAETTFRAPFATATGATATATLVE